MKIDITLTVKCEGGIDSILALILRRLDHMNQDITQLQADLTEINAKLTEQGAVLNKVSAETSATLAHVETLEAQIADLEDQLSNHDIVLPSEIKDTLAAIKAGIEANQNTLSGLDALVPDS